MTHRIQILALSFFITLITAASPANAAICPFNYLFELNGQHYYAAVRCTGPHCNPVRLTQLLIFNQQVQQFGCKAPGGPGTACECRTSLTAVGAIFHYDGDLSAHYPNQNPTSKNSITITNDDFVVTQFGANNYYFRTLTFAAKNSKTGEMESRSIAFPLTQKKVTELCHSGIAGKPVVFKETSFDGASVALRGVAFRSIATEQEIPRSTQIGYVSR